MDDIEMQLRQWKVNKYIDLVIDTLRRRLVMDEKWFRLEDSLTPSHDAQEAKGTPWPSSEVNWVVIEDPGTPPAVVVDQYPPDA